MRNPKTEIVPAPPASGQDGEGREALKCWALVELYGHNRIVGHLTEQPMGSAVMIRVDVPDLTKDGQVVRKGFTRFFGVGAIYSITPVTESAVRELLPVTSGEPVKDWDLYT